MNVASLELCKELFELSGWGKTDDPLANLDIDFWWVSYDTSKASDYGISFVNNVGWEDSVSEYPAYDLGYLLRKLPAQDNPGYWLNVSAFYKDGDRLTRWIAAYYGDDDNEREQWADTPEDAAAKLAISLWKQGVLK